MLMKPVLSVSHLSLVVWMISIAAADSHVIAAQPDSPPVAISKEDVEFFEKSIRPVLVEKCYGCHSAQAKQLKGELRLDSRQGIATGGESGEIINGRDPDQSRLIQAIRWTDADLRMPPSGKLTRGANRLVGALGSNGCARPARRRRGDNARRRTEKDRSGTGAQVVGVSAGRPQDAPVVDDARWAKQKIDHFVLAKLEENQLKPSPHGRSRDADPARLPRPDRPAADLRRG